MKLIVWWHLADYALCRPQLIHRYSTNSDEFLEFPRLQFLLIILTQKELTFPLHCLSKTALMNEYKWNFSISSSNISSSSISNISRKDSWRWKESRLLCSFRTNEDKNMIFVIFLEKCIFFFNIRNFCVGVFCHRWFYITKKIDFAGKINAFM